MQLRLWGATSSTLQPNSIADRSHWWIQDFPDGAPAPKGDLLFRPFVTPPPPPPAPGKLRKPLFDESLDIYNF